MTLGLSMPPVGAAGLGLAVLGVRGVRPATAGEALGVREGCGEEVWLGAVGEGLEVRVGVR